MVSGPIYTTQLLPSPLKIAFLKRTDTCFFMSLKPVFHFNRIVPKRSVFLYFLRTRVELMTSTQNKMLRYVTIEVNWLKESYPVQWNVACDFMFFFCSWVLKKLLFGCIRCRFTLSSWRCFHLWSLRSAASSQVVSNVRSKWRYRNNYFC